ncbi:peptidase, partial [Corchorus olitorius]
HVLRRDHVALVVAPGVALVGDHGGDVDFRELLAERGHCGAGAAMEHHAQMVFLRPGGHFRSLERREHRWKALALGLVTGHA